MSKKTDLDALLRLSTEEFEARIRGCADRIESRMDRALDENRDWTDRELDLSRQDKNELSALKDASELRDARDRQLEEMQARNQQIQAAIDMHQRGNQLSPLFPSAANLARLEEARATMASLSVIEERAVVQTGDMGTAREYGPNNLLAPRTLWRASGIPTTQPPGGYAAVTPQFTLPDGVALVAENVAHAEFDAVNPDTVTIGRAGAWTDLSSEAMLSTSLTEITAAHARIIGRNVDLAVVTKIEDADSGLTIDEALVTVAGECACDVSDLWIVGPPADVATLAGTAVFTPANGPDIGSYAVRYGGAALYVTPAATALTVFHPGSFRAFASPLASAVVVDPTKGTQRFGSWHFFGLGQSLVGSAVTVGTGSGSGS